MLKSKIEIKNGNPTLTVDGKKTTAMAYTTYFEERGREIDFIKAGYRIFFVNVSFTTAPINSFTGFSPFRVGVFENPDEPDYSEFENAVYKILAACPDAVIFPRINISMPKWWIESHPDDVASTLRGGYRESLVSESFRKDGEKLLSALVEHIISSSYADRIGGWQICGGMTQEWFHHGYNGSLCPASEQEYKQYAGQNVTLPKPSDYLNDGKGGYNKNENARRYAIFSSVGVARTIEHFASVIKRKTASEQIVGVFYGYAFESNGTVLFGSHALRCLLDSPSLDFFSSPNAYTNNRALGIDWADMIPVDSVKHHGKLAFIECDVRTNLTISIQEARPGEYPDDIYRTKDGKSVWVGPPTREESVEALRKCFAHQICKGSAIWWFDMWGGWYDAPLFMDELSKMKKIYDEGTEKAKTSHTPDVAVFIDEEGYSNLYDKSPELAGIYATRTALGDTGVPFDSFLVNDAADVLARYKAAVFVMPIPSESGKKAIELAEGLGIPYLAASLDNPCLTVGELSDFYKKSQIHFYTDRGDVVYLGNGYIGMHSKSGGKKRLYLKESCTATPIIGDTLPESNGSVIEFNLEKHKTVLFALDNQGQKYYN